MNVNILVIILYYSLQNVTIGKLGREHMRSLLFLATAYKSTKSLKIKILIDKNYNNQENF